MYKIRNKYTNVVQYQILGYDVYIHPVSNRNTYSYRTYIDIVGIFGGNAGIDDIVLIVDIGLVVGIVFVGDIFIITIPTYIGNDIVALSPEINVDSINY